MTITTSRGPRTVRALALPLLAAASIGLTACGGDSGSTTTAAAASGGNAPQGTPDQGGYGAQGGRGGGFGGQTAAERTKLQACLKKAGVTLPTRRGGGAAGPGGTGTNGAPPSGTTGAPPSGANGGPPAGGLPGGGGAGGAGGFGGMTAAERKKFQAAMKSCGVTTSQGGANRAGGRARPNVDSAAYRKSIEAYAACVRKNGFDLPKPDFSGNGPIFDPKTVDQTDPTFKKASAACQSTLQQGRPSGGAAGGAGTTTGSGAQS